MSQTWPFFLTRPHPQDGVLAPPKEYCKDLWRKRKEDTASVPETYSAHLLPYNLEPTRRKFSRQTVSGWEEPFVIHDSIIDLWVGPKTSSTVTWIKHQHISASHRNFKPPSGGTITTEQCLTHIRDAARSESHRGRVKIHERGLTTCLFYLIFITGTWGSS